MDAGLAAVLGALAGAVATTGAAFATGWATREQAKIAARGEHRRQRRDARQAVYEEFIASALTLADKTKIVLLPAPQNDGDVILLLRESGHTNLRSFAADVKSLYDELRRLLPRLQLAGPEKVNTAADAVIDKSREVMGYMGGILALANPPIDDEWHEAWRRWSDFKDAIPPLTEAARVALDDDGTK